MALLFNPIFDKVNMRISLRLIIIMLTCPPIIGNCQSTDTLINKLDSLKKQTDTTKQVNQIEPNLYDERTKMNLKVYGVLLLDDFKQQAYSPLEIKQKGWLKGAAIVAGTIGMSFLDKPIQRSSVDFINKNPGTDDISGAITNIGGIYQGAVFAMVATWGFAFKNPKLRTTTALASQSYITSMFWSYLFKNLSGRLRPNHPSYSNKLNGPFYTSNSSFPSQHTTLAFAAARVYAMEYKNKPIVPIVSYSVASLISLSRLTENKHWATDIIAGALLGYACGTQVVNNYHRYAKLVRTGAIKKKKKKGDIALNVQYLPGAGVTPGFVYTFR